MRKMYHHKTICPICGKKHNDVSVVDQVAAPYTGIQPNPRFNCKECTNKLKTREKQRKYQKMTHKQPTTHLGVSITRGINKEQKAKLDMDCERMGRRWRGKWGIEAPAHVWYIKWPNWKPGGVRPVY